MDTILLDKISKVGINLTEDQIKKLLKIKDIKSDEGQIEIYKDIISKFFYLEENREYVNIPNFNFGEFSNNANDGNGWFIETEFNILEDLITDPDERNRFLSKKEIDNLDTVFLIQNKIRGTNVVRPLITLDKMRFRRMDGSIKDRYYPIFFINENIIQRVNSGVMRDKVIYFGGKINYIQINQKQQLKRSSSELKSDSPNFGVTENIPTMEQWNAMLSPSLEVKPQKVPTLEQWNAMSTTNLKDDYSLSVNNPDKKFKSIASQGFEPTRTLKETKSETELSEINSPINLERSLSTFSNFERSFTPVIPIPGSRFDVIKLLGKGSYNIVYLIKDQNNGEEYIYRKSINQKKKQVFKDVYKKIRSLDLDIRKVSNFDNEDNIGFIEIKAKYKLKDSTNIKYHLNQIRRRYVNNFYLIDYRINTHDAIIDNLNQTLLFSYIESLNLKLLIPEIIYVCKEKPLFHNSPHICSIMEKMDGTLKDIFSEQFNIVKSINRFSEFLNSSKEIKDIKKEDQTEKQKAIIRNLEVNYGEDYEDKINEKINLLISKKINEVDMLEIWLEFLFQICCGLFFLQDNLEFNHNDMKMDNIFFKYVDPDTDKIIKDNFRVFIGDFGFSRFKIGDLVSEPSLLNRQQYDKNFDIYLFLLCHVISWDGTTKLLPDGLYDNIKEEAGKIIEFCKVNPIPDIELTNCLQGGYDINNVLELYNFGAVRDIYTNPVNVLKYLKDNHSFDVQRCKSLFCKN